MNTGDTMKKLLRVAALVGIVGLSWSSLKKAEANPNIPLMPDHCTEGAPCATDGDCGWDQELNNFAGVCGYYHTCFCR
jgi:hypothetical protein